MKIGIYAGSFDPITKGHIDIINRATKLVDKLVIGILYNKNKQGLFSVEDRMDLINKSLIENNMDMSCIEVDAYYGLLVDFAKSKNATINIRGVRTNNDYEYEMNMAQINKELYNDLETVLLVANSNMSIISSSMVKEIASFKGDVSRYVSESVNEALARL